MKKLGVFILLALLLTFWATPVYAAPPALPHAFYGSVTITGATTPDNSQISATVDSGEIVATQNPVATEGDTYGIDSPKLLVQGDIPNGAAITFYVNGVEAEGQTAIFEAGGGPTLQDLTVPATAPSLVTSAATAVTTGSAIVRGSLGSLGTALSADVSFEWGTTTAYGNTTVVSVSQTGDFSATLSGLSDDTTYHFRAVAVGHGTSYGADRTFTTRAEPAVVAPPTPPAGTTDVRGLVSNEGVFQELVTATSEDELCTLTISEGTVGLTEELEPIDEITMVIMDEPPPPPEDAHVIGLTYDFGPDKATFEPPITLAFSYDPDALPEGVAEEDLVLAFYDEATGEWIELEGCVVDPVTKTITASVSHFTTFAVIGRVSAPAPPEEEEVPTVVPPVEEEEEEEEPVVVTPEPAAFSVSSLAVEPAEVGPKEPVAISVSIANTGGTEGSYTVVLKINGVKEVEKSITLAAGSIETWFLFVEREDPGNYTVDVDGLSGSFTVVALVKPPGINWPLVGGGIAGGVVVVGLLYYFLVFRRRAY